MESANTNEKIKLSEKIQGPKKRGSLNALLNGWSEFKRNYFGMSYANKFYFAQDQLLDLIADKLEENEDIKRVIVVFYHGLDATGNLLKGIRIVKADVNPVNGYRLLDPSLKLGKEGCLPSHELVWTDADFTPPQIHFQRITAPAVWKIYQDSYYDKIRVNRTGVNPVDPVDLQQIHRQCDPKAVLFSWEIEIKKVYEHNKENKELRFVVENFSDFIMEDDVRVEIEGEAGHRHSVSLHMQEEVSPNNWNDLLDNGSHNPHFKMRGVDYGNLCPPRCKDFKQM